MKKSTKPLLYFAYGSNLNKFDWNHHRYRPPFDDCFEKVSNAWLPDYVPAFTYDSPVRSGGVLDVVARPGCCTPGVVFRLKSRKGLDALRQKEGSPYSIIPATVMTSDNRLVEVFTFTIKPRYVLRDFVTPSEEYVTVVRKGLRYHKLSTDVLDAVVARTHVPYIDTFFFYGTLRKGECRYQVVKELGILSEQPGKVRGRLYDCGAYPAITLDAPLKSLVYGDFIKVRDLGKAFRQIDAIEGYRPGGTHNLYNRRLVPVRLDDKTVRIAWIYEFARDLPETIIASGDWFRR